MATEDTERSKRGNQHHGLLNGSRSARREAGFTPSTLLYLVVRGSSRRDQISTVAWEPTRALVRGHRPEPPPLTCVVFALDISSHTLTRSSQPASLPGSISFLSLSLSHQQSLSRLKASEYAQRRFFCPAVNSQTALVLYGPSAGSP